MNLPQTTKEESPHGFTNLGWKPHSIQPTEYLGSVSPEIVTPPDFENPSAFGAQIYNQLLLPACGAHASAFLSALLHKVPAITPRFSWINMKQYGFDKNPNDGVEINDIFTSESNYGANVFEPLGNDTTLTPDEYASPTVITPSMLADASTRKLGNPSYVYAPTFQQIKDHIFQNGAQIMEIQVGDSMWTKADGTMSWAPEDVLPLRIPNPVIDGHFVVAHSFNENYIYFANSWGQTWGAGGHGWFGADYMPFVLAIGTAEPCV